MADCTVLVAVHTVTAVREASSYQFHPGAYYCHPFMSRWAAAQDCLDDVPVYAHVKEVCLPDGTMEALEITYITLYAHNGWYALGGMSWAPRVGAHDGDWEHLTVRLRAPNFSCQARLALLQQAAATLRQVEMTAGTSLQDASL